MIFNPRVVQLTGARIALLPPSDLSASAGNTQVSLTWTDPGDETSGGQVVAEWEFTRIVRKVGSAPANQNDGVIVVDSTVKNQYLSEPFVDTGLTNGTTYYYGAFACSAAGAWSDGAFVSATPQDAYILGELTEGTLVKIKENGSPVEFYVAKQNYEPGFNGDGRTLMVRKDCYNNQKMANTDISTYANSAIDTWLNGSYKNLFSSIVRSFISTTQIRYTIGNGNNSVGNLQRSIFILSLTELGYSGVNINVEGNILPISNTLKIAYLNNSPTSQWSRSPYLSHNNVFWIVNEEGESEINGYAYYNGVRPCFTLPQNALIDLDMNLIESYAPPPIETPLSNLAEGTLITIKENGAPIEFYVACQNYESDLNGAGRVLCVRKDVQSNQDWNGTLNNAYATSDIDTWFNSTYKSALSSTVQTMIGTTEFYYTPGDGSTSVTTLTRSVFALSLTELGGSTTYANIEGTELPISNNLQIANFNGSPNSQWTRTPSINGTTYVQLINSLGYVGNAQTNNAYGSRPCFTLPSTAQVDTNNALIES